MLSSCIHQGLAFSFGGSLATAPNLEMADLSASTQTRLTESMLQHPKSQVLGTTFRYPSFTSFLGIYSRILSTLLLTTHLLIHPHKHTDLTLVPSLKTLFQTTALSLPFNHGFRGYLLTAYLSRENTSSLLYSLVCCPQDSAHLGHTQILLNTQISLQYPSPLKQFPRHGESSPCPAIFLTLFPSCLHYLTL